VLGNDFFVRKYLAANNPAESGADQNDDNAHDEKMITHGQKNLQSEPPDNNSQSEVVCKRKV